VISSLTPFTSQVQNRWTRISIGPYTDGVGRDEKPEYNRLFVQLLQNGGVKDAEEYGENDLQMVRWHKIAVRPIT
jgi:2-dehydropantoate 2-reductase